MDHKIKVLITDAGYKHTLGAVRSLGKAGFFVIVMSPHKIAQSFFSRYCDEKLICPNPKDEQQFIEFLIAYLKTNTVDVLLPIGYISTVTIAKHKEKLLPYVKIPIADYELMQIASNKEKTMQFAKRLNIPIPLEYKSVKDIETFPIVAKGIYESGHIHYLNSPEDFQQIDFNEYILQEYIPGEGYGFYALFYHGTVRAYFMHKRVREYPITGGASTCAVSIYDEDLKNEGLRLLESLNWHGVAMVEFKKDRRDKKFKLMEINPKFWGSLDLSIASGVNFPVLIVTMALERDFIPVFQYHVGVKFRWPFPDDILHLFANPKAFFNILGEYFDKNSKSNLWLNDFLPSIVQMYNTSSIVLPRVIRGNLRYPHGRPRMREENDNF